MSFNDLRLKSSLLNPYACPLLWRARAKISANEEDVEFIRLSSELEKKKPKTKLVASAVTTSVLLQECRRDCWGHQDIFQHGLHSKDTEVPRALCAADPEKVLPSVYLTDKQISAQNATSGWASLVSKLHCLETSVLMGSIGTKLGLLLSYTYCNAGLWQAEHKARKDDGAELFRGCAAKQGSLQCEALPQQLAVAAVIKHDIQEVRNHGFISWKLERHHGTVLQMGQAWTDHRGKSR